ncbi:MAG: hypothetical protein GF400_09995 [Candidatus Eisenbacteria bacterium]|nr:hypothetical protein [Candidatus Eisenbacteria bacterium]
MRSRTVCLLCTGATLLLTAALAIAAVPTTMNYQVMITDNSDQPIADTAVEIVFSLYTDPLVGTMEWTETHNTTTNSIGVVSVVLGSDTPLDPADFDAPLWLEIEVEGETLAPRREITSAAFALRAHDSDYLGGVEASEYALSSGTGDGHSLDAADGNPVNQVYVDPAGDVGIGTTGPNEDLHIHDAGGLAYERFTNSSTGTGAGDGFRIGINGAGNAFLIQHEPQSLRFSTDDTYRGMFDSDGTFELGSDTVDGGFEFYGAGATSPLIEMHDDSNTGGKIEVHGSSGALLSTLETDSSNNDAGYFYVDNASSGGFYVDGYYPGQGGPRVEIEGDSSTSMFLGYESGDDAVVLPTDAINAAEMYNEPGVASTSASTTIALDGTAQNLLIRTITPPGPGYVIAMASAEVYADPGGDGSTAGAYFGVSTTGGDIATNNEMYLRVPSTAGSGQWNQIVSAIGIFETIGGPDAFYFVGDDVIGEWTVAERSLTLLFVPTNYGTVSRARYGESIDPETETRPAGRALTAADEALERAESVAANQVRIDAEIAALKAQLEELRAHVDTEND